MVKAYLWGPGMARFVAWRGEFCAEGCRMAGAGVGVLGQARYGTSHGEGR